MTSSHEDAALVARVLTAAINPGLSVTSQEAQRAAEILRGTGPTMAGTLDAIIGQAQDGGIVIIQASDATTAREDFIAQAATHAEMVVGTAPGEGIGLLVLTSSSGFEAFTQALESEIPMVVFTESGDTDELARAEVAVHTAGHVIPGLLDFETMSDLNTAVSTQEHIETIAEALSEYGYAIAYADQSGAGLEACLPTASQKAGVMLLNAYADHRSAADEANDIGLAAVVFGDQAGVELFMESRST